MGSTRTLGSHNTGRYTDHPRPTEETPCIVTWTLADLDEGTTLLTVNNRLATELRARYDSMQLAVGRKAWPSADILPWHAWLTRQYQQLLDTGHTCLDLLNPAQERLVWREVIERSGETGALLRPAAAAEVHRPHTGCAATGSWTNTHLRPLAAARRGHSLNGVAHSRPNWRNASCSARQA